MLSNDQLAQAPAASKAEASKFVATVNDVFLFPLIGLLLGIAFLVFLYGVAVYVMNANNEQSRSEGRKHIMFGIIGMVVMISAYTLLTIAANTFGLAVPE